MLRDCYDKPLEDVELSLRGWNWGSAEVDERDMKFVVRNKLAFALPLANIANSNIAGRTEVSMEFLNPKEQQPEQNTGASSNLGGLPFNGPKKNRPDQLVEMRLYIPGQIERDEDEKVAIKKDEGEEADEEEDEEEEESAAAAFHNAIKAKADIGQVAGDGILVLKEVLVLTPRGRYDIDLFPEFLRLRGKTYDYKILYSSITQLFLLPKPDDIHVLFVIALEPPIRQGQTRYPFLVLQFPREEEMDAELNLDEETIQTKYDGKLKKRYEEPTFRIVTNLFRVFSQQKVNVPTGFTSSIGQESVRCNVKANDGTLYPLNKSLIWVSKQTILVPYSDIHQLVFSRVGGAIASAKTFDLRVETRHGGDHTFQSINREEFDSLNNFFAERKIRIKNELADDAAGLGKAVDELLDEDEDVKGLPDDDDDDEEGTYHADSPIRRRGLRGRVVRGRRQPLGRVQRRGRRLCRGRRRRETQEQEAKDVGANLAVVLYRAIGHAGGGPSDHGRTRRRAGHRHWVRVRRTQLTPQRPDELGQVDRRPKSARPLAATHRRRCGRRIADRLGRRRAPGRLLPPAGPDAPQRKVGGHRLGHAAWIGTCLCATRSPLVGLSPPRAGHPALSHARQASRRL